MEIKKSGFYANAYLRHGGVTGSCIFISAHWPTGKNIRFFVDAGAAQGEDNNEFYNSFSRLIQEKLALEF